MQLSTSNGFDDHDPDEMLSFSILPFGATQPSPAQIDDGAPSQPVDSPTTALFKAVSACANLHPDPASPSSSATNQDAQLDEGDYADAPAFDYGVADGLPPPIPGSGGWITSENMDQFFDDDGNWKGNGLGPGAGIVREREDDDETSQDMADGGGANGEGVDGSKWRRTA